MTGQEILARAKEDRVRLVSLQFTDVSGTIKSLTIPVERLPGAIKEGMWFDGSSIEGFTRIFESEAGELSDTADVSRWEGALRRDYYVYGERRHISSSRYSVT